MNKLQLYITINYQQYKQMLDINPDEYVNKYVVDLSSATDCINYDDKSKHIFYLLKYTDKGVFLVILRTIPADTKSHLAAWIFIPSEVDITDKELDKVAAKVVSIITKPSIKSDDVATLQNIFKQEYPTQSIYGATVANQGVDYAHRFYGNDVGYELIDFLGSMRYQPQYLPYAGVLLIDKAITDDVYGTDLTDEPLNQIVKIFPPKSSSTKYKPYLFGEAFDRPMLVPLMCTVEILWKSDSAVDKHQSIMISQPNMRIEAPAEPKPETIINNDDDNLLIDINESTEELPSEATPSKEANEKEGDIDPADLLTEALNSTPTMPAISTLPPLGLDEELLPEAEAEDKQPEIKAPTAEATKADVLPEKEEKPDAPKPAAKDTETAIKSQPTAPVKPKPSLAEKMQSQSFSNNGQHTYKFELPAKSADIGGMIKFTVSSRTALTESPIDGYSSDADIQEGNRVNYLKYDGGNPMQQKLLWGIGGAVLGVLLTLLCVLLFSSGPADTDANSEDNDSTEVASAVVAENRADAKSGPETKAEGKSAEQQSAPKDVSAAAAIAYLDTNKVWEKSELESYPDLKGLYNDLNTFNRERITKHWASKLKESRRFATVVEHAKLGKKKKPRVPAGQKTFNVGNDGTIKVQQYLNTIDP